MSVERAPAESSLIDVLDRVLDKGIVIDAWVRLSLVGIDLITVEARVVVASFETYLRYADAFASAAPRTLIVKQIAAGLQLQVADHVPGLPERINPSKRAAGRKRSA